MIQTPPDFRSPVAVFGWGVSGKGAAAMLERFGLSYIAFDERGVRGAYPFFNEKYASRFSQAIHSPGFRPEHLWMQTARACNVECIAEMDFASLFWKGPLVAVTGTNGKTTLTEFLAHALHRTGIESVPVGNIGFPFSRIHEKASNASALAVCEVSSFQAEALRYFSPHAVLWTNFDEDHLDRHPTMKAYFEAKWRLVERLSRPRLIVGESVSVWAKRLGAVLPPYAEVVSRADAARLIPKESPFVTYPQQENYLVARAWWLQEGLPLSELEAAAREFQLAGHRLRKVATVRGVTYWNDSKATNFHAVYAAVRAFERPVVWIGCGKPKGGDIAAFARRMAETVGMAVIFGEASGLLAEAMEASGCKLLRCQEIEEAVRLAQSHAEEGGHVLFSPGFASFDQFSGYADRGQHFERIVMSLGDTQTRTRQTLTA